MSENNAEKLIERLKNYQPFGEIRNKPEIYNLWDDEKTKAYFKPEYINYSKKLYSTLTSRTHADCYILDKKFIAIIIKSIKKHHKRSLSESEQLGNMLLSHQIAEELLLFLVESIRVHIQVILYPEMVHFPAIKDNNERNIKKYCLRLEELWLDSLFDHLEVERIIHLAKKLNTNRNKLAHSFFRGEDINKLLCEYFIYFEQFIEIFLGILSCLDCTIKIKDFEETMLEWFSDQ